MYILEINELNLETIGASISLQVLITKAEARILMLEVSLIKNCKIYSSTVSTLQMPGRSVRRKTFSNPGMLVTGFSMFSSVTINLKYIKIPHFKLKEKKKYRLVVQCFF